MSIKVMTRVWDSYPGKGGELLLALAMADIADDTGENIYQSVSTLAKKSRQKERVVRLQLSNMRERGLVEITGVHPLYQTNIYRICLEKLQPDLFEGAKNAGVQKMQGGTANRSEGAKNAGVQKTHNPPDLRSANTSLDPSLILLKAGHENAGWFDPEAWEEWCQHRKEIKKKMTERAAVQCIRIIASFVSQGYTMRELIDWNMGQSNQGIYEPRKGTAQKPSGGKLRRAMEAHLNRMSING